VIRPSLTGVLCLMTVSAAARSSATTPVRLPPHERHLLDNGLEVVVATRPGLPLATVEIVVQGGAALDPPGKAGLASLTAELLRRGTRTRTAEAIEAAIEFVGGHLDVHAGQDFTTVAASVPAEALDTALSVVADVTVAPQFAPAEVKYVRARTLGELAQHLDDPSAVADRALLLSLLGEEHPYAAPVQGFARTVAKLERKDVVAFHRQIFAPARTRLVVVGDVDPAEVVRLARKRLGAWKNAGTLPPPIPAPEAPPSNRILVVHKPGATQVQVRMVAPAFAHRSDPDYFPAVVANGIFGGGFTSRLVDEIRVNRGLSYGASSRFSQLRAGGFFTFRSFTRNETVGELLQVVLGEAGKARAEGFRAEELERTQRYLSGLYPLRLETNEQIAGALVEMLVYELPEDWVPRYRERLRAVTLEEADGAARRWFFAGPFAMVLVGDRAAIQKGLKDAGVDGKVRVVPIADLE
jgi:zinc protease